MTGHADAETRAAVEQLLATYCHRVDHDDGDGWAALFCEDGVFEVPGAIRLSGRAEIVTMPTVVKQHGGGRWRHQITNIACADAGTDRLRVTAYGLVTDWGNGGQPVSFTDYDIELERGDGGWRIRQLVANPA